MNFFQQIEDHWKGVIAISTLLLAFMATVVSIMSYLEGVIELKASQAINIEHIRKIDSLETLVNNIEYSNKKVNETLSNRVKDTERNIEAFKRVQSTDNIDVNVSFSLQRSQHLALTLFHQWGYSLSFQAYGGERAAILAKTNWNTKEAGVAVVLDDKLPKKRALKILKHLVRGIGLPITHINKVIWAKSSEKQPYKYNIEVLSINRVRDIRTFNKISSEQLEEILSDQYLEIGGESSYTKHVKYLR